MYGGNRSDLLVRRLTSFQTSLTKSNLFGFQSDCRVVVHSHFLRWWKTGKQRAGKKAVVRFEH